MIKIKNILLCALISVSAIGFVAQVDAKQTKRDGKWEATFQLINNQSEFVDGGNGSSLDIDSDVGWGFSLGYNVNEHFLLNYEFASTTPGYIATIAEDGNAGNTEVIDHSMDLFQSQFNAIYNFSTEQLTPYVQAGIGWTYVDSNIADGPPDGVCYWDPWWGYICDSYQDTFSDNTFTYNVAAGFRYELDNHLLFKLSYQQVWLDMGKADTSLGMIRLEIGSIF